MSVDAAKILMKAIEEADRNKTTPYDIKGVVKRIEGRTAWIKLSDEIDETPVERTIDCSPGDVVQVRISGGSAWLTGNSTEPPTGDRVAKQALKAAGEANEGLQQAGEQIEQLSKDVTDKQADHVETEYCLSESNSEFVQHGNWSTLLPDPVAGCYYWKRTATYYADGNIGYSEPIFDMSNQLSAEIAAALASTNNHFWNDESGAYVTERDGTYEEGYASRITASGILQSYMGNLLTAWTSSGVTFYQSDGETPMAEYGAAGMNLYAAGALAMALASGSISFYDSDGQTRLAYIGASASQNLFGLVSDVVEAQKYQVVGSFVWVANSDGSMTLKKVG